MNPRTTRREFLADVGKGVLVASVGGALAGELGLTTSSALADDTSDTLTFGKLEPLVALMQETPIARLLPILVERLNQQTDLRELLAAAALANARTFGGEDYVGFHTMMALAPAFHMAQELPLAQQPLPVLKVLYRNTNRIQEHGGRKGEVLGVVRPTDAVDGEANGEALRGAVRRRDVDSAERMFAGMARSSPEQLLNHLLVAVEDETEVHRVVLPYRAWDMLDLIGKDHAHTLLRQSIRYCIKAESYPHHDGVEGPRAILPRLLEQHDLLIRPVGQKRAEDAWVRELSQTFFSSTPQQSAEAAAAALAEGIAPDDIGEALALAANQLVLRDYGRSPREESVGKPLGSVHGDSIGVHACDSANAWRNLARISNARNTCACLILGAYQVAKDRVERGGDFLNWQPLPWATHVERVAMTDADELLRELETAVRGNLQARACALVQRYGALGHPARGVFDLLLRFAVSEDGSLHAEKFYRTTSEEFATTRPAFRWRHLTALARVTASEFGRPAPGYAEARTLLKI